MYFSGVRLASYSRGNIEIIDVDGPAEDLVRVRPGTATNSRRPRGARPGALAPRVGLDAPSNVCVDLPFRLADEMCKDATCISDCTH